MFYFQVAVEVQCADHCIWFGQCGMIKNKGPYNCLNDTAPQILTNKTAVKIMKKFCPTLVPDGGMFNLLYCFKLS